MSASNVRMLMRYNMWANKLIYEAVTALPDGEATKERNPSERNRSFKSITHTLNHNYIVDVIWQAHLEGRQHGFEARSAPTHPPLDQLWHEQQVMNEWYAAYSDQLLDTAFDEKVNFTLIGGNKGVMTRGEILLHVVNHSTYHRGYIANMFYQIPVSPPKMDLPVYFREIYR